MPKKLTRLIKLQNKTGMNKQQALEQMRKEDEEDQTQKR